MTNGFIAFIRNLAAQVNSAAQVALRFAQRADGKLRMFATFPSPMANFSCRPCFSRIVNLHFKQRNGAARLSAQE